MKQMTTERAMELLNDIVDNMTISQDNNIAIWQLLGLGFRADELVEVFGFSSTDVQEVAKEMEEEI